MTTRRAPSSLPNTEPQPEPEQERITVADGFQAASQATSIVWATIPQIPGGLLEMGDMAADVLHIPDWEAGG